MPVKGLLEAPGAIKEKVQETLTIYLAKGIAYLTTVRREQEPVKCYPGTSAVIPATRNKAGELAPDSIKLEALSGQWVAEPMKADTKNRDAHVLDANVTKFVAGRGHVTALPGTEICVAEGQTLNSALGSWVKVSGKVEPAEPVTAKAAKP